MAVARGLILAVLVALVARAVSAAPKASLCNYLVMVFLAFLRGTAIAKLMENFGILPVLVLTASLSHPVQAARQTPSGHFYKSHVKGLLKLISPLFTLIDLTYYLLPIVSFGVTKDWKRVFYDCFTPFSLWLDAVHAISYLFLNLFFIKDLVERLDVLCSEFGGILPTFLSIYQYLTLKSLEQNQTPKLQVTKQHTKKQVVTMIVVYVLVASVVVIQLEHRWFLVECINYRKTLKTIAGAMTAVVCFCEIGQMAIPIYQRVKEKNWDDDEPRVRSTKIAAAVFTAVASGYDTYSGVELKNYLSHGYFTTCALIMTSVTTGSAILLIVVRSIGPRRLHQAYEKICQWLEAAKDYCQMHVNDWVKRCGVCGKGLLNWCNNQVVKCCQVVKCW